MQISIKDNIKQVTKAVNGFADQVPFATAASLTTTAVDAQKYVKQMLIIEIDRPTPFTKSAPRYTRATKRSLTSTVYLAATQYKYLKWTIDGGTQYPAGIAHAIPVGAKRNKYGNKTRRAIQTALNKKNTFSGTVRGVDGIWQRYNKNHKVKLLFAYAPVTRYKAGQFKYYQHVNTIVDAKFDLNFAKAWRTALDTARWN